MNIRLKREEIETTRKGLLVEINNKKHLLVSFGGIRQGLGIPVFEFFNSLVTMDCDKIFFRDYEQAWYHKGVDSEIDSIDKILIFLKKIIKEEEYKKVCFLGNSMGGFAAILFGSILNVDKIIAFAPQIFIDKKNRFFKADSRWKEQIVNLYNSPGISSEYFDLKKVIKNSNLKVDIDIYYSSKHNLDRKHAERLKNINNITLHPINNGGHSVVKELRDSGDLKKLLQLSFI